MVLHDWQKFSKVSKKSLSQFSVLTLGSDLPLSQYKARDLEQKGELSSLRCAYSTGSICARGAQCVSTSLTSWGCNALLWLFLLRSPSGTLGFTILSDSPALPLNQRQGNYWDRASAPVWGSILGGLLLKQHLCSALLESSVWALHGAVQGATEASVCLALLDGISTTQQVFLPEIL